ncbi:unnamed protein product [Linum trigynum]|uniref:Uncharacterized protein n=1 Tax=Linum trigynum TaxID=586398 RepID=A0AAV2EVM2_9ROSI
MSCSYPACLKPSAGAQAIPLHGPIRGVGSPTPPVCFFVGDPTPSVPAETVNDGHSLVNKAALDLNLAPGSVLGKRTLINDLDAANKKLKTQDSSQTSSFSSADATSKLLLSGMAKEAANLKLPAYET